MYSIERKVTILGREKKFNFNRLYVIIKAERRGIETKLVVVMSQSKGMMGGVSFEVKGRIDLTPEEQELVRHYKLEGETLTKKKMKNIWGQLTDTEVSISVGMLLRGDSFKCKNLGEVIAYRDSLVDGCRNLKAYLDVARSFGGEVVIDIDELVHRGSDRGDDQDA